MGSMHGIVASLVGIKERDGKLFGKRAGRACCRRMLAFACVVLKVEGAERCDERPRCR